jgi:hypothetical protein
MEYLVAFGGGAGGYSSTGIPAAWLVGPDGKIVWKGHPAELKHGTIETHIKNVRLRPTFRFQSDELKKAGKLLEAGNFGKGLAELDKVVAANEEPAAVEEATAARTQILAYGEEELKAVEDFASHGYYSEGMLKLQELSAIFKGTEIGDKADEQEKTWKKDDKIKAELEGSEAIAQAKDLIGRRGYKDAARLLVQVTRGKKFEGTKARERAEALMKEVEPHL